MQIVTKNLTLEQYFLRWLKDKGFILNATEARIIFEQFKSKMNEIEPSMLERWSESANGYDEMTIKSWLVWLIDIRKEWLEENKPNHWAKNIFD